ncbi:hypothetical protein AJ79_00168 [Helicocarpus griseus UAMH5409]|uniref:phosphoinositide 5-phosphatase n=1 Tax=Helicocarpus griseus UAMH5409 TaxID=1447875 RepID=A0A2B7YBV6_9EURO|nr:hypothetical protein AJ79_00168 [Helicocarpus griseus UAMH5409]
MSSLRVLCRDRPVRALALVSDSYALIFNHVPIKAETASTASYANVSPPKCRIEFVDDFNHEDYRSVGDACGTLGLIALGGDVFLCTIARASEVATVRPGETVQNIVSVQFYCLNRSDYDINLNYETRNNFAYPDESDYGTGYEGRETVTNNPFGPLQKLLSDGSFYYSVDFNLTDRLQDRADETASFDIDSLDRDFLWNSYMIEPLLKFRSHLSESQRQTLDSCRILTSAIRGFVYTLKIPASSPLMPSVHSNLPANLTLISRLSSRRAGTRFNSRGIDDEGNVSNFVETETVVWIPPGICFSYTQVRGSLPIFWEQTVGFSTQNIQITRSTGASQPAFDRHFDNMSLNYGAVHVVNLLTENKTAEAELSDRYRYHIARSPLRQDRDSDTSSQHHLLRATDYDFHAETKGPAGYESASMIRNRIEASASAFGYFLATDTRADKEALICTENTRKRQTVLLQQNGVFRTNCLDCLDRTNLVQTIISQMALETFLIQQGGVIPGDFWRRHSTLWADNGDNLSKIYAGTGALKSSYTRHGKMSIAGAFADMRKSATRLYVNAFEDEARQNTIDLLLGALKGQSMVHLYDPIGDAVEKGLWQRAQEFTSSKTISIWVGTFNLNGRSDGAKVTDLSPWLLPQLESLHEDPSIVAVGFQEIVELSPQQIMSTNPRNRIIWENAVKDTLDYYANRKGVTSYVLLRSGQLVGTALLVFAKSELLDDITAIEGSVRMTGLSGIAGNKGGCAIRLQYLNTRICFITAHLAAGFTNYDERNRDYRTISEGLRFQKNKTIEDHDAIIWLGDFNYRIGLPDARVRELIKAGDFESLYEHDQLNLQMVAGLAFPFYAEGKIKFPPTYKYNNGTDEYDTSEKARIPAWCDRVLWKGTILRQLAYNAAPLRFSDHRPVYAIFDCDISVVNEALRDKIKHRLYEYEQSHVGRQVVDSAESDDGFDAIHPDLPPASSDSRKWWLDNGWPAQSTLEPPVGSVPNPHQAPNPFVKTSDSDWIHIPRPNIATSGNQAALSPPKSHPPLIDLQDSEEPPPSLPMRSISGLSAAPLIDLQDSVEPIPSSPNRASGLSGASNGDSRVSKKQAPPVPSKPVSMSVGMGPTHSPTAETMKSPQEVAAFSNRSLPPAPRRRKGSSSEDGGVVLEKLGSSGKALPPPVQPRRTKPQRAFTDLTELRDEAPRLPPRPPAPVMAAPNSSSSTSLLDFDGDESENLTGWKPLRSQRRTDD